MIPAYVINLPRDAARLARIQAQFAALDGFAVTYVNAVDGSTLADSVCEFITDSGFWARFKGAIGCFMSHLRVWEMIAGADCRYAVVIEDDADVSRLGDLDRLVLPDDFDIVFINARMSPKTGGNGVVGMAEALPCVDLNHAGFGTDGYLLTPASAAKLVAAAAKDLLYGHIDGRLARYATSPRELAALGDAPVAAVLRKHHNPKRLPELGLLKGYAAATPLVAHSPGPSTRNIMDAPAKRAPAEKPASAAAPKPRHGLKTGLKRATFKELATSRQIIFEACDVLLPRVCVYQNIHEFDAKYAEHAERDLYRARAVSFNAVELVALPAGTVVHANHTYVTTVDDVFVVEQVPPWVNEASPENDALESRAPRINIDEPALLVARFGHQTWGHWLGELLPRVVAAEAACPGKFKFVVPAETTNRMNSFLLFQNILGSLSAYGIADERLIRIGRENRYVFGNLHAVTPMWVNRSAIHPSAMKILRSSLRVAVPSLAHPMPSVTLLRLAESGGQIQNDSEIVDFLRIKGFLPVNIGSLPFIEQVGIFQQANTLFGTLGSGFAGLIYAPQDVKIVSGAPSTWHDTFFHALMQARSAVYADVRGTLEPGASLQKAPFTLSITRIAEALAAVGHG